MPILRAADAPTFEVGGNTLTSFSAPSRGSQEVLLYRVDVPPGGGLPLHRHDHDDVFTLVEGTATVRLDGEPAAELGPGDTVVARAGMLHPVTAGEQGAVLMVAMLAGTLFITDDGERVPPWGV